MTTPNENGDAAPKIEDAAATTTDANGNNLSAMEAAVIEMLKNTNLQSKGQPLQVVQHPGGMLGAEEEGTQKHAFWDTQVRYVVLTDLLDQMHIYWSFCVFCEGAPIETRSHIFYFVHSFVPKLPT
jgi:hypothetical protein